MSKIIFIRNLGPCFCELIQQLHKELYVIMLSFSGFQTVTSAGPH